MASLDKLLFTSLKTLIRCMDRNKISFEAQGLERDRGRSLEQGLPTAEDGEILR